MDEEGDVLRVLAGDDRATVRSDAVPSLLPLLALSFVISWSCWSVAWLLPEGGGRLALVAGTFGPSASALFLLHRDGGRGAVRRALGRLVRLRGAIGLTAVAVAVPPLLAAAGVLGDRYLGGTGRIEWPSPGAIPVIVLYVLLFGGPLGEELGWRGAALPAMERRWGPVTASLALGAAWALWHLPLFVVPGTVQQLVPPWLFVAQIVITSFLYTWLVHRGPESLVPVLALHTSFNVTVGLVLLQPAADPAVRPMVLTLLGAAALAAVAAHRLARDRTQPHPGGR